MNLLVLVLWKVISLDPPQFPLLLKPLDIRLLCEQDAVESTLGRRPLAQSAVLEEVIVPEISNLTRVQKAVLCCQLVSNLTFRCEQVVIGGKLIWYSYKKVLAHQYHLTTRRHKDGELILKMILSIDVIEEKLDQGEDGETSVSVHAEPGVYQDHHPALCLAAIHWYHHSRLWSPQ